MITELLQDTKTGLREFPWFAALVILAIVVSAGFNMAILNQADGDHLQVRMNKELSAEEQVNQVRLNRCSEELKPGFTVIAGMRQYSMELSVPVAGVCSLFNDMQTDIATALCGSARVA